jgi:hypothetical protein
MASIMKASWNNAQKIERKRPISYTQVAYFQFWCCFFSVLYPDSLDCNVTIHTHILGGLRKNHEALQYKKSW